MWECKSSEDVWKTCLERSFPAPWDPATLHNSVTNKWTPLGFFGNGFMPWRIFSLLRKSIADQVCSQPFLDGVEMAMLLTVTKYITEAKFWLTAFSPGFLRFPLDLFVQVPGVQGNSDCVWKAQLCPWFHLLCSPLSIPCDWCKEVECICVQTFLWVHSAPTISQYVNKVAVLL